MDGGLMVGRQYADIADTLPLRDFLAFTWV